VLGSVNDWCEHVPLRTIVAPGLAAPSFACRSPHVAGVSARAAGAVARSRTIGTSQRRIDRGSIPKVAETARRY
jgi:hypothetical protein